MDALTARLERVEAEVTYHVVAGAPAQVRRRLGTRSVRLGGGVALAVAGDPSGARNRALGFGVEEAVSAGLVEQVCAFYAASGVGSALVHIAPAALPPDWPEIAERAGLRASEPWLKLSRPAAGTVADAPTDLRVAAVPRADLERWGQVLASDSGSSADLLAPMFTAAVSPGCQALAAWDGPEMVAAAILFLAGGVAELCGAVTLPSHRGRGAQSALLRARIQAAVDAGAQQIGVECGVETPGHPDPSLHNLRRAGLQVRYQRPSWLWTAR